MLKQVHIIVSGKVQGVFFRAYIEAKAQELGICGRIKNLQDGSVDIIAEGPKDCITKLIEWCYKGPPAAHVENVKVDWDIALAKFSSFRIEY